ncbi:hypothetical protein PCASD_03835 [Puccinia coronata f. sp. avenae]|uniref:Uncharacterized protein n=1 Tax=Puccinia coronata f. sp. avenae TaxID=200324 RepID=A0A2N5V2P9_9BASI|nr:hypothetical protein PCASD_17211 [Puccinia coronata f. sp. avenae]PLW44273.1 hypothetical protein PCASD_03835 [Puccinia coronata f. sp. avenae]
MNWRAYLLVVSLAIMVASANYKAPLHTDRQLAALADHIASPARSNNRRVRFDHNVGAIINPRGNEIQTITSDSNRDEQPQQETREFLVHFSKSSSGDPESHHGDSQCQRKGDPSNNRESQPVSKTS